MSTPISIKLHDLISSARAGKLHDVAQRDAELARLVRLLLRPTHHHAVLVAEPGSGKSSLIEALALRLHQGRYRPLEPKVYRLATDPIKSLLVGGDSLRSCLAALAAATTQLPTAIVIIEDIQLLAGDDPTRLELTTSLLQALASHPGIRLIATTTPSAFQRLFQNDYAFNRTFDALQLPDTNPTQTAAMLEHILPRLERHHRQTITPDAVAQAIAYAVRFGHGRALPDSAIRLLEECCTQTGIDGQDQVTAATVKAVVAERERLPLSDLDPAATQQDLAALEPQLHQAVVGQSPAIRTIARHLIKAQLGLGDPTRPRGSFLLLGPSGVGKTETARALSRLVYRNPQALVRLDMSEYAESHAAVRLIGSPPGYVGYEEGGQLTGAVLREPYSLVLLDEIEKAHPKLFDLFLQLLDDGRLTDSSGKTVDFTETLVLATSNAGSADITAAAAAGHNVHSPQFLQSTIMPLLLRSFRPEFINRFDAVLIYQPLALSQLVNLAQRELARLGQRLAKLGITFAVPDATLAAMLAPTLNPLFGARPVRRLIASHFETPIADRLVRRQLAGPITITGAEPWISDATMAGEGIAQ